MAKQDKYSDSIKEYKTVCVELAMDLDAAVSSHIKDGWQPYGFPTMDNHAQTMVKHKTEFENLDDALTLKRKKEEDEKISKCLKQLNDIFTYHLDRLVKPWVDKSEKEKSLEKQLAAAKQELKDWKMYNDMVILNHSNPGKQIIDIVDGPIVVEEKDETK